MAFPATTTATTTSFGTSVTTMAVNLPGSIDSGDLLLAWSSVRNAGTWTVPTDWVEVDSQSSGGVGELTFFYKIADGLESSTATWTARTATTAAWHVRRITSWHGTTAPEVAKSTSGGTPSTDPDPPSLTPSWGSGDTLWLAIEQSSAEDITSMTSVPTGYSDGVYTHISAGGASCSVATSYKESAAASENPGILYHECSAEVVGLYDCWGEASGCWWWPYYTSIQDDSFRSGVNGYFQHQEVRTRAGIP